MNAHSLGVTYTQIMNTFLNIYILYSKLCVGLRSQESFVTIVFSFCGDLITKVRVS